MDKIADIFFPETQGCTLNDTDMTLPQDIVTECALLVLSYKRWHQDYIDTWTPYITDLVREWSELELYYVSISGSINRFARTIISGYMKRTFQSRAARAAHIMLYTDVAAFNLQLSLPSPNTIYLVLIERSGEVLWQGQDVFDPQQFAQLSAVLARRLKNPGC